MLGAVWGCDFIHLVGSITLRGHSQSAPPFCWISLFVVARIFINLRLLFSERNPVPLPLKSLGISSVNKDVLVNVANCFSVFARVAFLPDIASDKVRPAKNLVHDDLE